ncbi:MAG: hypothetical protein ACK5OA_11190, partial [Acidovorax sp.]
AHCGTGSEITETKLRQQPGVLGKERRALLWRQCGACGQTCGNLSIKVMVIHRKLHWPNFVPACRTAGEGSDAHGWQ